MTNPTIFAKLIIWGYGPYLYVDLVPTGIGNSNLEARSGDAVVTSIQIVVGSNVDGATFVDDFFRSYYDLAYRRVGGDMSKWITLEYKDTVLVDVNISDINDTPSRPAGAGEGYIGEGGRRFPLRMDPATTPRLYAAKKQALRVMNEHLGDEVLKDSIPVVAFILTINPLVAPTSPQRVSRSRLPRDVQTRLAAGAGGKAVLEELAARTGGTLDPYAAAGGTDWKLVTVPRGTRLYGAGGPGKMTMKWGGFEEQSLAEYVPENQWSPGFAGGSDEAETPIYEYCIDIQQDTLAGMSKVAREPKAGMPLPSPPKLQYYNPAGFGTPVRGRLLGYVK